jgi:tRNA pseudouridine55 synthase
MDFIEGEILFFNKPLTWTSFQLVAKVRYQICKKLHIKKLKVGHAGTLDPLATGVMIICTGKATKQIENFQYQTKEYIATLELGATTLSYDLEKPVDKRFDYSHVNRDLVEKALEKFKGRIEQVPPSFSACKVDGKRAYEMARKGKEVSLKPKILVIDEIELMEYSLPVVTLRIVCSKGTYIRALARDLGEELGCGAYLTSLCRTRIGDVKLSDCIDFDNFTKIIDTLNYDTDSVVPNQD